MTALAMGSERYAGRARQAWLLSANGLFAAAALVAGVSSWGGAGTTADVVALGAAMALFANLRRTVRGDSLSLASAVYARTVVAAGVALSLGREGQGWPCAAVGALLIGAVSAEPAVAALHRVEMPFASGLPGLRAAPPLPDWDGWVVLASMIGTVLVGVVSIFDFPRVMAVVVALIAIGPLLVNGIMSWTRRRSAHVQSTDLRAAIAAYAPEFILYTARPDDASYQVAMWLPYFERTGRRFVIMTRYVLPGRALAGLSRHPVIACPTIPDLESMLVPSIRAAFYVNASSGNNALVRFGRLAHIYIGHGDSDKAPSYNPTHAMYDKIFAAGPAAIRRYGAHGVRIPPEKFTIVGRPQVEGIDAALGPLHSIEHPAVLYAPTWRGHVEETALSSLSVGPRIISALLERGAKVIFRPHPFSYDFPEDAQTIREIHALLAADERRTGQHHLYGPAAEAERSIQDCINQSDAMISDVSSVVSDYLFSLKPFAMVAVPTTPDAFRFEYPIARAAYVVSGDLGNMTPVLDDLLGPDPLMPAREAVRRDYLGDLAREGYAGHFVRAVSEAIECQPPRRDEESEWEAEISGAYVGSPRRILNALLTTGSGGLTLAATVVGGARSVGAGLAVLASLNIARLVRGSVRPRDAWPNLVGQYAPARALLLTAPLLVAPDLTRSLPLFVSYSLAIAALSAEVGARRAWALRGPEVRGLAGVDTAVEERLGRGWIFPLAWAAVAGAWLPLAGQTWTWTWMAVCVAYFVVVAFAVWTGALRQLRRLSVDILLPSALERTAPRFIVYFASTMGAHYQIGMWLPYLEAIGQSFLIVTRNIPMFCEAVELTDAPVLNRPTLRSVADVVSPSVTTAFYVNNAIKNTHLVERRDITHVWLNHGDSEKPACFNPVHAIYDLIFAAGQAGVDRYARHGVLIPPEKFRIVGRPQVAQISGSTKPISSIESPTVLYAPTWKGPYADSRVHSIPQGREIIAALVARGATVIFRAHPFTYQDPSDAARIAEIGELLNSDRAAMGTPHLWGREAEVDLTIEQCFNASDAMIADVSAVVSDYLQSEKPFAMVSVGRTPEQLETEAPAARAAYIIEDGLANLGQVLDDLLGEDPLAAKRAQTRIYYLGDFPPEGYVDGFMNAAREVIGTDVAIAAGTRREQRLEGH